MQKHICAFVNNTKYKIQQQVYNNGLLKNNHSATSISAIDGGHFS